MTTPREKLTSSVTARSSLHAQIMGQLTEVMGKVNESLEQGRENGNELKMIRRELGLDGPHGRLPIMEASLVRLERQMEKSDMRLNLLEASYSEAHGKAKLVATVAALAGGSAGGALIAMISHLMGGH